ncbi:Hypothetical Protein SLY_0088 [Strawberry lethal yellows phytoplasma (CPA) str. NZSb11]|uniref:Uncharacterized protein n=1 Tax=Strawberry lethal yellows phytoplasma (CPA) str. NZSb11 TaxID=980422 RepID=R4RZW7_PHYAS|nr:Hypothetical Protein SLY_0088 [Strawberry lethal yellows phytoplasma (CPA) str. NZSb11]
MFSFFIKTKKKKEIFQSLLSLYYFFCFFTRDKKDTEYNK